MGNIDNTIMGEETIFINGLFAKGIQKSGNVA